MCRRINSRTHTKSCNGWSFPPEVAGKIFDILNKLELGEELIPLELQILYIVNRRAHLKFFVIPHLEAGDVVLCDRYELSTYVYGSLGGVTPEEVTYWQGKILGKYYRKPNVTFIIDIAPQTSFKRLYGDPEKTRDMFEGKMEFLEKTYLMYKSILSVAYGYEPEDVIFIDGEAGPEIVHERIWTELRKYIE